MNGATDAELAELSVRASETSRWSAIIHAQNYDYNTFVKETEEIGVHLQKAMSQKQAQPESSTGRLLDGWRLGAWSDAERIHPRG